MEILSRENPSSTSTTKARTSKQIVEDVYKTWRKTTERIHILSEKLARTSKYKDIIERKMFKSLLHIKEQCFDDTDHRIFNRSSNKKGFDTHRNRDQRNKNASRKQNTSKIPRNFTVDARKCTQNHSRREINEENAFVADKIDEIVQELINCYQKVLQNSYNTKNDEPLEESSEKRPFEYQNTQK